MKIHILCSDPGHPIHPKLQEWAERQRQDHDVRIRHALAELETEGGDLLFLISCHEIVPATVRGRYRKCLVIHASDLPKGRGWSPWVWQILEGHNTLTVTLLEADDVVDSGPIWHKVQVVLEGHELAEEIHARLFDAELSLMDYAVRHFHTVTPTPQTGEPTHYRRRTPEDCRLDVHRSIAEQFDLLRIADPARYPAFFDYRGHRYYVILKKANP